MRIVCVALLALAIGCHSPTTPETPVVPSSAMIDGATVTIETSAYRNLQPSILPNGQLFVVVRLHSASAAVRSALSVQAVSVTSRATGEHWIAAGVQPGTPPAPGDDFVEFVARGGPEWPVGTPCAVVVLVRGAGGTATLGNEVPIRAVS